MLLVDVEVGVVLFGFVLVYVVSLRVRVVMERRVRM